MTVYQIDPMKDERWDDFLSRHPAASIFHTRDWIEALRKTYGYEPVAFTTSPPGSPLTNGVLFCRIVGWFNRRRLVSLPFSDHCAPLVESPEQLACLLTTLQEKLDREKWSYIETRTADSVMNHCKDFGKGPTFYLHKLDLRPSVDEIFQKFHPDCVRRKIRRAAREGLTYEAGRSPSLVAKFYQLLLMTRRRHGLPAQPADWFRNIVACVGNKANIQVASKDGQPIASIFTLRYKNVLVYKYGCSDRRFSSLGGTQLLLWNAIQQAKRDQVLEVDMGRSDCNNSGLVTFKDRWGAVRSKMVYRRYPVPYADNMSEATQGRIGKYIWSHAPLNVLAVAGSVLYKYVG